MQFNKIAILALLMGVALPAVAREEEPKSELVFALTGEYYKNNERKDVNVPQLNRKLNAAGEDGLPEVIVVTKTPERYWKVLEKRLNKAMEIGVYGEGVEIFSPILNGYFHEYPEICYRGKTADVPKILKAMEDNFLHVDQWVLGLRYGTKKVINDDRIRTEAAMQEAWDTDNEGERADWNDYDTSSETVLVLSDLGPQGDGMELYSTKIARCPEEENNN